MAEKYYLLSKDVGDGPYYIGDLERLSKGRYRFKYAFSGERFPKWFMHIPNLDNINKEYTDEEVVHGILDRIAFEPTHMFVRSFMDSYGFKDVATEDYDQWDALVALCEEHKRAHPVWDIWPKHDCKQLLYFYEELPSILNRYDII